MDDSQHTGQASGPARQQDRQQDRPQDASFHTLNSFPLLAGTWDFLDLGARIDALLPRTEAAAPGNGTLCRALALQLADTDMSRLVRTRQFFARAEARVLPDVPLPDRAGLLAPEHFCRLLDQVAAMGCENFFNALSAGIWERLGWPVQAVSLSTTAARLSVVSREDNDAGLSIGGARKVHHVQDADEYVLTTFSDRATGLPVFLQDITSMAPEDKMGSRSSLFADALAKAGSALRKAFPNVRHMVVDSPLCTAKFIQTAREAGLQVVSKLSTQNVARYLDTHAIDPAAFVDLAKTVHEDGQESLIRAQWCQDVVAGREHVRALLVEDGERADKKRAKIFQQAARELKAARAALKRNSRQASEEAAQDFVNRLTAELQLCRLENVTITRQEKASKPRGSKVWTGSFLVQAEVLVDQQTVDSRCAQDVRTCRSVVVSTDPDFPWTMEELWQTSRGPHAVSPWLLFKDKIVWVKRDFVATDERYRALLSLFHLFVLLLKLTEKLLREAMARDGLVLEGLDGTPLPAPDLQHVLELTSHYAMAVLREKGEVQLLLHPDLQKILQAMGKPWYAYIDPETY